jgi:spermidine/putrescine transport system permease protein
MIYSYLPFAILPLYSTATKFNFSLHEAARDLGATKYGAFFKVFLPFLKPAILTASLMVFIPSAGAYVIPEIVGGHETVMLGNKMAQTVFVERNLPEASVTALLLALIIFLPSFIAEILRAKTTMKKGGGT